MNDAKIGTPAAPADHFIPVRKTDILAALDSHGALSPAENAKFRKLGRILGALCHYEYLEPLEKLRDAYFYFNPERDPHARFDGEAREQAYAHLLDALTAALREANFVELPHDEIDAAHRAHPVLRVNIQATLDDFREIRFFRRGRHRESFVVPGRFGLRRQNVEAEVFDDVVMLIAMKTEDQLPKRETARLARAKIRPGCVLIKYFRNVASADLRALFPNARVVMSFLDKLMLGVPAVAGGIPIFLNLASTLTVLFAVAGFYLGLRGAVQDDEMQKALAALSGLLALGGLMVRQWVGYQRQTLKHQKALTDNFYFRNITNNAGIFDSIIGMAEDQEYKEALLAYYFLLTAAEPPDEAGLRDRVEGWLHSAFGSTIAFESGDALAMLERLDLLVRDGERLKVVPAGEAIVRIDRRWDNIFTPEPA